MFVTATLNARTFKATAGGIPYGVCITRGRRPYLQDVYKVEDDVGQGSIFFGVFDGHGGRRCPSFVSERLPKRIKEGKPYSSDPETTLSEACLDVDNEYILKARKEGHYDGTTGIMCLLSGRRLTVVNVGDSRAVLGRGNSVLALSDDQKPSRPDEKRRIMDAGGRVLFNGVWRVEGSLAVSRAFGDVELKRRGVQRFGTSPKMTRTGGFASPPRTPTSPSMSVSSPASTLASPSTRKQEGFLVTARPEVSEFDLNASTDDFIVLASDGLWDVVSNDEAITIVRKSANSIGGAALALVQEAFRRNSMDNICALVVDLRPYLQRVGGGLPMIGRGMMTAGEVNLHANEGAQFQHDANALASVGHSGEGGKDRRHMAHHGMLKHGHSHHDNRATNRSGGAGVEVEGHQIASPSEADAKKSGGSNSRGGSGKKREKPHAAHSGEGSNYVDSGARTLGMQPKFASRKVFDEMMRQLDTGKKPTPKKPIGARHTVDGGGGAGMTSYYGGARRANHPVGSQAFQRAMRARGVPARSKQKEGGGDEEIPAGKASLPVTRPLTHQMRGRTDVVPPSSSPSSAPHDLLGQGVTGRRAGNERKGGRVPGAQGGGVAKTLGWPLLS